MRGLSTHAGGKSMNAQQHKLDQILTHNRIPMLRNLDKSYNRIPMPEESRQGQIPLKGPALVVIKF